MYDLTDQFINYLRLERGLADNTIQAYSRDLLKFTRFLEKSDLNPLQISREQIE